MSTVVGFGRPISSLLKPQYPTRLLRQRTTNERSAIGFLQGPRIIIVKGNQKDQRCKQHLLCAGLWTITGYVVRRKSNLQFTSSYHSVPPPSHWKVPKASFIALRLIPLISFSSVKPRSMWDFIMIVQFLPTFALRTAHSRAVLNCRLGSAFLCLFNVTEVVEVSPAIRTHDGLYFPQPLSSLKHSFLMGQLSCHIQWISHIFDLRAVESCTEYTANFNASGPWTEWM